MKKITNEIYALVDEEFMSKFNDTHRTFMREFYYTYYREFCLHYKRKQLSTDDFYTNMHRRRIQLFQLCCPYCGAIEILPIDKKIHGTSSPNFCPYCGRSSTIDNVKKQLSRFVRIRGINRLGLKELKASHPDTEDWLLAYDCYQVEIIELASIIEVVCRDYFEALLFINNMASSNSCTRFIRKVVEKSNGNDFMNIEKANNLFQKAFEIDLKSYMDKKVWNDLVDIVNLRNMMIHNNGRVDKRFENTGTYQRWNIRIDDKLFRLEDNDVSEFLKSVIFAISDITDIYLQNYYSQRNVTIANYYFNNKEITG